jgi:hypothetical protein
MLNCTTAKAVAALIDIIISAIICNMVIIIVFLFNSQVLRAIGPKGHWS